MSPGLSGGASSLTKAHPPGHTKLTFSGAPNTIQAKPQVRPDLSHSSHQVSGWAGNVALYVGCQGVGSSRLPDTPLIGCRRLCRPFREGAGGFSIPLWQCQSRSCLLPFLIRSFTPHRPDVCHLVWACVHSLRRADETKALAIMQICLGLTQVWWGHLALMNTHHSPANDSITLLNPLQCQYR